MNSNQIRDKVTLIDYIDRGYHPKYLFFWGHQPNPDGTIGKTCFSQWFVAGFEVDGIYYPTAEHYMMAAKARLFDDHQTLAKILNARHPGEAKKLGREVQNFQIEIWLEQRLKIVVDGNVAKFSQTEQLKNFLLNTESRILVEASPVDRIWGIGLAANDPNSTKPDRWPGLNLLGFALMAVREILQT